MKRYLYIFKNHKKSLFFLFFIGIIQSLIYIANIYFDSITIDTVVQATELNRIINILIIGGILAISNIFIMYIKMYFSDTLKEKIKFLFRADILNHLQKIDITEYHKFDAAYLSKRIIDDTGNYISFFLQNFLRLFQSIAEIIVITLLLFRISPLMASLTFLIFPLYALLNHFLKEPLKNTNLQLNETDAVFFNDYSLQISNIETIVLESKFETERYYLKKSFENYFDRFKQHFFVNRNFEALNFLITVVLSTTVILIGGYGVINGTNTIGETVISTSLIQRNIFNLNKFMEIVRRYHLTKASVERIDELYNKPQQIEGSRELLTLNSMRASIKYYLDESPLIFIEDISVKRGEITAISGKNGAGKSTLIKILSGALKEKAIDTFNIKINDLDIQKLDSFQFRNKHIFYMAQHFTNLDLTIKEFFNRTHAIKEYQALFDTLEGRSVLIPDEITNMINSNWDSKISQLSGGERRLIKIIQMALSDADLFFLDEPTANLDTSKLEWFKALLLTLKQNKFIVMINHDNYFDNITDSSIQLGEVHNND